MKEKESKNFLSSAFTDLMASLAVIFILLTVVFIRSASQASKKAKETVRTQLAEVLGKNKLPLEQDLNDPLTLSVRVNESLLKFALNSSALSGAGGEFLDGFFPALAAELCSEPTRSRLDAVVIEGHTDRSGESGPDGIGNNIRLSQNRSYSVLSRTLSSIRQDPALYECVLKLVLASGRGSSAPIELDGVYSADLSRRVEIKIRVKSNEQEYFLKEKQKL
jgi:outer membrane protein OmpA-like peptidoglycan-associated protein